MNGFITALWVRMAGAPDRAALMGKASQRMADMKTIREADERWLCILSGEPYEARFQSGEAAHVYDGNNDANNYENENELDATTQAKSHIPMTMAKLWIWHSDTKNSVYLPAHFNTRTHAR